MTGDFSIRRRRRPLSASFQHPHASHDRVRTAATVPATLTVILALAWRATRELTAKLDRLKVHCIRACLIVWQEEWNGAKVD